jgi:hypothetical protein
MLDKRAIFCYIARSETIGGHTMSEKMFRVVKTTTNDFGKEQSITVLEVWSGTDLEVLSEQYPPSDVFGADPLGHAQIEDGWIRWNYTFETRENESKEWEQIPDPRTRLNATMSDLEAAIDAENRRLYPGDYDDGYDEYDDYEEFDREDDWDDEDISDDPTEPSNPTTDGDPIVEKVSTNANQVLGLMAFLDSCGQ